MLKENPLISGYKFIVFQWKGFDIIFFSNHLQIEENHYIKILLGHTTIVRKDQTGHKWQWFDAEEISMNWKR